MSHTNIAMVIATFIYYQYIVCSPFVDNSDNDGGAACDDVIILSAVQAFLQCDKPACTLFGTLFLLSGQKDY